MRSFSFFLLIGLAVAATEQDNKKYIKIFGARGFPKVDAIYESYYGAPAIKYYADPIVTDSRSVKSYASPYATLFRSIAVPNFVRESHVARAATLSDISNDPVMLMIPGEGSDLEVRLCANGLACLADIPVAGRSALYFDPRSIAARDIQKLGVPGMKVKNVALPEGTKLSALVRANYLLLSKEGESNFKDIAAVKDIGDVEVAGHSIRVFNNNPYKEEYY